MRHHDKTGRSKRIWLWTAAAVASGTAAALTAISLTHHATVTPPSAVSTVAENSRACLLSDPSQAASATVLAGMQQTANTRGGLNVQQVTLAAQATDAAPELAGLIQQQCTVILALGPLSSAAAINAATNPQPHAVAFIAITDTPVTGTDITTLSPAKLTSDQVTTSLNTALK